jgi:hypothetical protein
MGSEMAARIDLEVHDRRALGAHQVVDGKGETGATRLVVLGPSLRQLELAETTA